MQATNSFMFRFIRLTNDRIYISDVTNIPLCLSISIVKYLKLKHTNANLMLIAKAKFSR